MRRSPRPPRDKVSAMATDASPENARVQALFQLLGKTQATSLMRDVQGTLEFDLADAGHWQMKIDRGAVRVTEGTPERPDCVLVTDPEEFVRIVRGDDNIVAALLRGAIQLSGNLNVAMSFRRVLPIHA
jgi:putative sterol carrier protein